MLHFEWFLLSSKERYIPFGKTGWALVIPPGDAYSYSSYTLPAWRGKGIAANVAMVKYDYLKMAGCTRKLHHHDRNRIQYVRSSVKPNNLKAKRIVYSVRVLRSKKSWLFGTNTDEAFAFVKML
jgi:hypothetical protein